MFRLVSARSGRWRAAGLATVVVCFLTVTLFPIYWIFISAITPANQLFGVSSSYLPLHLSLVNFRAAAVAAPIAQEFLNSVILSVGSSVVAVFVGLLASYAFARLDFTGRDLVLVAILLSGFLPGIGTVLPIFQIYKLLHLLNTFPGLIILYVGVIISFTTFILYSFIRHIPVEIEESAQVDGAPTLRVWWSIVLPLLRPAIATVFIIDIITCWQEFLVPLIFSRDASTAPLTIGITQAAVEAGQSQQINWGSEAAFGLIMIAPVLIFAIVFQRQIIEGLMAGALKG